MRCIETCFYLNVTKMIKIIFIIEEKNKSLNGEFRAVVKHEDGNPGILFYWNKKNEQVSQHERDPCLDMEYLLWVHDE